MEKIENDFICYWIKDDILYSEFKKPTIVTLENAKEMILLRHQISNNINRYWCVDFSNLKSFTKEGRDYAEVHGQDFLNATAAVVNSHITSFLLNTFMKIKKPIIPLKSFKSKEDAVKWLTELKLESTN